MRFTASLLILFSFLGAAVAFAQGKPKKTIVVPLEEEDAKAFAKKLKKRKLKAKKVKPRDVIQSDILVSDGILFLNVKKWFAAERYFKQALQVNPKNFVAYEYLAVLEEHQGKIDRAIGWLLKGLKIIPPKRKASFYFHLGRLYHEYARTYKADDLPNKEFFKRKRIFAKRGFDYAEKAFELGTFPIQGRYLLGYLKYKKDELLEAETLFREARVLAASKDVTHAEIQMRQALFYYLGETYTRLGYLNYAVSSFQNVEAGNSWELRAQAWKNHAGLNQTFVNFDIGAEGQYDTTVVRLPLHHSSPIAVSEKANPKLSILGNIQVHSGLSRRWVFGFGGEFELQRNVNAELNNFNYTHFEGKLFARYWNRKTWLLQLQYNPERAWIKTFSPLQTLHTGKLFYQYFPYQRWNWKIGGLYAINDFEELPDAGNDARSGAILGGFIEVKVDAPNPGFQPLFEYSYLIDSADGANFKSTTHLLNAEFKIRLDRNWDWIPQLGLSLTSFPDHPSGRTDVLTKMGMELDYNMFQYLLLYVGVEKLYNQSTLPEFAYHRLAATGGLRYRF